MLSYLLQVRTENSEYPFGGILLGLREGPESSVYRDVKALAETDSALPIGSVRIRVTEAATQAMKRDSVRFGSIVPGPESMAPMAWGEAIALGIALRSALGADAFRITGEDARAMSWRHEVAIDIDRKIVKYAKAYTALDAAGVHVDSGAFRMRMTYIPEEWWSFIRPLLTERTAESITHTRHVVRCGGSIGWAI